jgi:hypothetical protein
LACGRIRHTQRNLNGFREEVVMPVRAAAFATSIVFVTALAGCGGGGEGPRPPSPAPIVAAQPSTIAGDPPQTFLIRPGASWKPIPPQTSFVDALASLELARINGGVPVRAGSVLEVRSTGSFFFDVLNSLATGATGVLVDATGRRLTPGTGSTVAATSSAVDCSQPAGPDAVPEDFLIPAGSFATLVVPSGAVALHLSVDDCFYNDNRVVPLDPIRVTVVLRP